MELSIAINSYKNPELLKLCIDSIKKNVKGIEYEIIVADSETEEDTKMMMKDNHPDVNFIPFEKNVGFQRLVKKGIEQSKSEYILLLNADILVKEGSVEKMVNYLKNNPTIGIMGPQLLNFNNTLQYSCFRFYKPTTILYRRTFLGKFGFAKKHVDWFLMKDYNHKDIKDVDWLMGSALLTTKSAIEKVGHMDSRFFMYMEDVDWCRRFWEQGLSVIYFPESVMIHYHKQSSKGGIISIFFNKLTWVHISSAIKYFLKYFRKPIPHK